MAIQAALQTEILKQIDAALKKYQELRSRSKYKDLSDQQGDGLTSLSTQMFDMINRLAPLGSQYIESANTLVRKYGIENWYVVPHLAGILTALRDAYDAGYLSSVTELIHADVFADFAEMADHLLTEGYKDPAAVVIGSTLEEHLRKLCIKNGIAADVAAKPKKADQLNADLAGQSVYTKLDQKSITAWLDLRNKAAHGKYSEYSRDQVALMIQGIRDFMARVPA